MNNNNMILPLDKNPQLRTYNNTAFSNSVLFACCENAENWNLENALQLVSYPNENKLDFYMPFFMKWDCFQYKYFLFFGKKKHQFVRKLYKNIEKGYYIYLTVEGRYLPERFAYQKKDRTYDILLYGYNKIEDKFIIIGFNDKRQYKPQLLTSDDLFQCFSNRKEKYKVNNFVFKPKYDSFPAINKSKVVSSLTAYLNPPDHKELKLGMNAYNGFLNYIDECTDRININGFVTLKDHKNLLSRLVYLLLGESHEYCEIEKIRLEAERLFFLALKYNRHPQNKIKADIYKKIVEIKESERPIICTIVSKLKEKET